MHRNQDTVDSRSVVYKAYACHPCSGTCILGDPGAVSGDGEKSKFGRRKVKNAKKSPWGQCFNGPVPNGQASSGF